MLPKDGVAMKSNKRLFLLQFLLVLAACNFGCGGGMQSLPPSPDFSLSVSSASTNAVVGNAAPSVLLSVEPLNGFTGTVTITLLGVPAGVTVSPGLSFSASPGVSQAIAFSLSNSAALGPSAITIQGISGQSSHSTQVTLTVESLVHTYQTGSVLYLESGSATDVARIGLETNWGGSIVEVSLNGINFVNRHDTGREVQPSYRDGDNQSYNPTLGGDDVDQGSPTLASTVASDSLFVQAQPLQWYSEVHGGGLGRPVLGDVLVEQTVTAVATEPHTFEVHIKATHLGSDLHTITGQEFPAVYTNRDYNRFITYTGSNPWTNAATTVTLFPNLPAFNPAIYIAERWGALVNSQNQGLIVYSPSVTPYITGFAAPATGSGPTDDWTNYFAPLGNLSLGPGFVFEGDFYVIAGDLVAARQTIYRLHQGLTIPVIFAPFESTDLPSAGASISGSTTVSGWAFTEVATITKVEILVDSVSDGTAGYGQPRPDVQLAYPDSPLNVGFTYTLNTAAYSNGPHRVFVRLTDSSGNVAVAPSVPVTISNPSSAARSGSTSGEAHIERMPRPFKYSRLPRRLLREF
jgi:hypothetical protein